MSALHDVRVVLHHLFWFTSASPVALTSVTISTCSFSIIIIHWSMSRHGRNGSHNFFDLPDDSSFVCLVAASPCLLRI
jgi:hypothetical protein